MKGWVIFVHSVRMVFSNVDVALKLSVVPYSIYAVIQIYITLSVGTGLEQITAPGFDPTIGDPSEILATLGTVLIGALLSLIFTLWLVVAWHRFVLLEEQAIGIFAPFHAGPILGYIGKSILIGILVGLVAGLISGILAAFFAVVGLIGLIPVATIIGVAAGAFLFYRTSPAIVGSAIGRPLGIGAAWTATAGAGASIAILVVVLIIAALILEIPNYVSSDPASIISLIYSLVTGWFFMLISASVLTTFYGHYIEGRPID